MQWFINNRYEIKHLQNNPNEQVVLAFYGDAAKISSNENDKNIPVIVKIGNLYLTFNRAKGVNKETGASPDTVLIVEEKMGTLHPYSDLRQTLPMPTIIYNNDKNGTNSSDNQNLYYHQTNFFNGDDLFIHVCDYFYADSSNNNPTKQGQQQYQQQLFDSVTLSIGSDSRSGC